MTEQDQLILITCSDAFAVQSGPRRLLNGKIVQGAKAGQSTDIINLVIKNGCHVVNVAHTDCQWR